MLTFIIDGEITCKFMVRTAKNLFSANFDSEKWW